MGYPRNTAISKKTSAGKTPINIVSIVNFTGLFVGYVRSRMRPDTTARRKKAATITANVTPEIRSIDDIPNRVRMYGVAVALLYTPNNAERIALRTTPIITHTMTTSIYILISFFLMVTFSLL